MAAKEPGRQLTVMIRASLEDRLADHLAALRHAGLRRPTRIEVIEVLIEQLPLDGPELARRVEQLRARRPA